MRRIAIVSLIAINLSFCVFLGGCDKGTSVTASIDGPRGEIPQGLKKADYDEDHPTVLIRTSLGEMTVELDLEHAPIAVGNFLAYVGRRQYDGTLFHRVVEGYMALGGGYDAELKPRRAEFPIRNEAHHGVANLRGTLAMARDPEAIDSATNQFFINLADNSNLDHRDRTLEGYGYCVFGKISAGEEVLDKISAVNVADQPDFPQLPTSPIVIESIRRVR
jgi:cyclophilin family peptidyl-prolyl cis-trans isomerase